MSAVETEVTEAPAAAPAVTVNDLLTQYTNLRNSHAAGTTTDEDFDKQSRTLRRKIRNAGGTVRELKGEAPVEERAAKEPKAKKERKSRSSRVESGLDGDPRAQPMGKEAVEQLERTLNGQVDGISGLEQKSPEAVESEGLYGYGLDVLSDLTAERAIAKFEARFGEKPTWFCLMKPADFSAATALTLLILGPTPGGEGESATESPTAVATDEPNADSDEASLWEDETSEGEEDEGDDE